MSTRPPIKTFIIAALTTDGLIGRDSNHSAKDWTSKEDGQWFTRRTKQAGVCVGGRKSFDTIGRPMPGRLSVVMTRGDQYLVQGQPVSWLEDLTVLEVGSSEQQREKWLKPGQVALTNLGPEEILQKLAELGFSEAAICGGSTIYWLFMEKGLVERVYLTIEPVLFGRGVGLFSQSLDFKLHLEKTKQLSGQTLLLEYTVAAPRNEGKS